MDVNLWFFFSDFFGESIRYCSLESDITSRTEKPRNRKAPQQKRKRKITEWRMFPQFKYSIKIVGVKYLKLR